MIVVFIVIHHHRILTLFRYGHTDGHTLFLSRSSLFINFLSFDQKVFRLWAIQDRLNLPWEYQLPYLLAKKMYY